MSALNIFVVGSNRGIGLKLVKEMLVTFKPNRIFASYRTENKSKELFELALKNPQVHPILMDIVDETKYPGLISLIEQSTRGFGLNLLFINSGIFVEKPQSLNQVSKEMLMRHFEVNSVSPFLLAKAFLPLLELASEGNSTSPWGIRRAAIVNMSSVMGLPKFKDGPTGIGYAYSSSKCALNMLTTQLSLDTRDKKILTTLMNPGRMKTEISIQQSVSNIIKLMSTLNESHHGKFVNSVDGQEIPW